ncbi:condensation protein [Streptomyces spiramyceticus]|uniref:condensation protein n=1 Tax=Streptomyces spiramyceticus TaxID=299717 RepID=UPI00237B7CE5|nr:condensation protein [Streptomyces spiramyceticus]
MTALQHPARPGGPPQPPHARVPFTVVDEVTRHCLQPREPETVHIEVHLPTQPDPARLRAAFAEALRRHPRILMREAPGPWYRRRYEWELTRTPDTDVVTFPPATPDALPRARERALAFAPPLAVSPPVRLEVIGSVLLLTVNHTALDGPACLRVLATAAELYSGQSNAPATAAPARPAAPQSPQDQPGPLSGTGFAPIARVAPGTPTVATGNRMLITELPVPSRPRTAPYTVNDQLMVATARMIAHWNNEHDRPPRPMRITMPVDDRPRGPDMPIGNGTRLVEVPFTSKELATHSTPDLLHLTARRTRALKALPRPQLGHGAALLTAPVLPVGVRAAITRGLRRAVAPWTSTTLLSNIGRIPYALDFGEGTGRATAVWFSAPARMPRGLTVTTASTGGKLHLALRWSSALLGADDGERLRDLFTEYLAATATAEGGETQ